MSETALQLSLMGLEAALAGSVLLALFRLRALLGLGPIYAAVGVFYYLATLLAGTTFIRVTPDVLMSPGSVALFPASLFAVLFIYIRRDAEEARNMIYGLLAANVVASLLGLIVSQHFASPLAVNPFALPPQLFAQQPRLFVVGTLALFADTILIILVYETVSRWIRSLFLRIYVSLALVLIVDTLLFVTGGFFEHPAYHAILLSGVIGKSAAALVYAAALATYLTRFDLPEREAGESRLGIGGLFQVLTYRQRYEALRSQVTRDALTGAHSRRFFDEVMQTQLATAKRSGAALVVMMLDIDHFKRINDSYGHAEGDRALKIVAQALSGAVRSSDLVCRYGGEEFCIVMPGTSLEAAATLATRLREEVPAACTHAAIGNGRERITVTLGLAAFPADGESVEAILSAADRRLYLGKSQGRDQAVSVG